MASPTSISQSEDYQSSDEYFSRGQVAQPEHGGVVMLRNGFIDVKRQLKPSLEPDIDQIPINPEIEWLPRYWSEEDDAEFGHVSQSRE